MLLMLIGMCAYALIMQRGIEQEIAQVNNESVPASQALTQASLAASENRMVIYKHVTSTTEEEMKAMEAILAKNAKLFDDATKLYYSLPKTPEAETVIGKVKAAIGGIRAVRSTLLADSHKATAPEDIAKLVLRVRKDYDPHSDALSNNLAALQELEQGYVRARCQEMSAAAERIRLGLLLGGAGILVIAVAAGVLISGRINKALVSVSEVLRDASAQVGNASGQVANSSQSLAQGSTEQAASLEETSASLEELGGMTKRNADSAQNANTLAREAREATDAGAAQVTELVEAMGAIKTSSSNIAAIIKTIDEVAFQTNILALNAAVEAARAGEAGAGFAVVAEEVRNLAQRAASAARETAEKIDDSINKSSRGAEVSERVSKSLSVIAEKVRQVDALVGEIAVASKEQSQGLGQIGNAVTQMDQITQKNASVSEETASAAQELKSQAEVLSEAVVGLRAMVLRE